MEVFLARRLGQQLTDRCGHATPLLSVCQGSSNAGSFSMNLQWPPPGPSEATPTACQACTRNGLRPRHLRSNHAQQLLLNPALAMASVTGSSSRSHPTTCSTLQLYNPTSCSTPSTHNRLRHRNIQAVASHPSAMHGCIPQNEPEQPKTSSQWPPSPGP